MAEADLERLSLVSFWKYVKAEMHTTAISDTRSAYSTSDAPSSPPSRRALLPGAQEDMWPPFSVARLGNESGRA